MEMKNVVLLLLLGLAQGKFNMLYRSINITSTEWNRFLVGSQVFPSEESFNFVMAYYTHNIFA